MASSIDQSNAVACPRGDKFNSRWQHVPAADKSCQWQHIPAATNRSQSHYVPEATNSIAGGNMSPQRTNRASGNISPQRTNRSQSHYVPAGDKFNSRWQRHRTTPTNYSPDPERVEFTEETFWIDDPWTMVISVSRLSEGWRSFPGRALSDRDTGRAL